MGKNYLVVGRAKTGTTAISKALQNSLNNSAYHFEPQSLDFFNRGSHLSSDKPQVIKVIYENLGQEYNFCEKIVRNETNTCLEKTIAIVRDPRDEFLSRLLYSVYPHMMSGLYRRSDFDSFVSLIKRKESSPKSVSFFDLVDELNGITGKNLLFSFKKSYLDYVSFLNRNKNHFFRYKYEDFIRNDAVALSRYLGFSLSANRSVGKYKRVKRSSSFDNWKSYCLDTDLVILKKELGDIIESLGYTDWILCRNPKMLASEGSVYVRKLIREAGIKSSIIRMSKTRK